MKIIVLVKQVPNTTEMKVDKEKGTLIRDGVDTIINPDDLASLECALSIKDLFPETSITVITMGPKQAQKMLIDCYGYGIDEAVLVCDRAFSGSDTWATSYILSQAIKGYDYDLILAGKQAIDGDTAQVGPQVALHLNLAQVTCVKQIDHVSPTHLEVTKSYEKVDERCRVQLPCVLTIQGDEVNVRKANLSDVWDANEKEITVLDNEILKCDVKNIGLKGSLTQVKKTFVRPIEQKGEIIEGDINKAAQRIVDIVMNAAQ